MSKLYPLFLKIEGRPCLVVGGGEVAKRKIMVLLASGALVKVVSPAIDQRIVQLKEMMKGLTLCERVYEEADLDGAYLVIAATDDANVNETLFRQAVARGLMVNVVDKPELCNFYVPALVTRGDLKIAVSTNGTCPALAKKIRRDLEEQFGEYYETLLSCLGEIRCELFTKYPNDTRKRGEIMNGIVNSDIVEQSAELSREELLGEMKKWI